VLTVVYLALAIIGCGYVVLATVLGHGADAGGADAGHGTVHDAGGGYGVESTGHGSVTADSAVASAFHFPLFSPLALATLFGATGGFGLIAKSGFGVSDSMSLLIALPAALATAYAVTYASWRVTRSSVGSSEIRTRELVGAPGEVVTPIPQGGVGEVAVVVGGQRFSSAAREVNGAAIARGAEVVVRRMAGTTMLVEEAVAVRNARTPNG
jgi:membrane protein implicated in regulation of membrane protease activity